MFRRQRGNRAFKARVALLMLEILTWITRGDRFGRRGDPIATGFGVGRTGRVGKKRDKAIEPAFAPAKVIDGAPRRDGVNPRREFRFAAKRGQIFPDREPDFLAHVARTVFVAQHGVHEPKNRFVMAAHERAKSVLVARLGALHELALEFGGDFDERQPQGYDGQRGEGGLRVIHNVV